MASSIDVLARALAVEVAKNLQDSESWRICHDQLSKCKEHKSGGG